MQKWWARKISTWVPVILITFHNEVTGLVDEERAVDIVYTDFRKAFYIVFHIIEKLMKYGMDVQTVK